MSQANAFAVSIRNIPTLSKVVSRGLDAEAAIKAFCEHHQIMRNLMTASFYLEPVVMEDEPEAPLPLAEGAPPMSEPEPTTDTSDQPQ
jgi:hypothetical protein